MKTFTTAILFGTEQQPPEQAGSDYHFDALRDLEYEIEQIGGTMVFVADAATYDGAQSFSKSWIFDGYGVKKNGPVTADVLVLKDYLETSAALPTVNDPKLYTLCEDKHKTYRLLKEFSPNSTLVKNPQELAPALVACSTELAVAKSIIGANSEKVVIGNKATIMGHTLDYPVIVQSFLDSSVGISGIVDGLHDLRVVMLGNTPSLCMVRQPGKGELRAGLRFGASSFFFDPAQLPKQALAFVQKIDTQLQHYNHRAYSIDFAHTPEGFKLIELNKNPGLWPSKHHKSVEQFNKKFAQYIADIA